MSKRKNTVQILTVEQIKDLDYWWDGHSLIRVSTGNTKKK